MLTRHTNNSSSGVDMRFSLLGPLEVMSYHDECVPLGGPRQRAMLAMLLLHPNRIVSLRRFDNTFWDEDPPATSRKILQNSASGLRASLRRAAGSDSPAVLVTQAPGYLLRVDPRSIDLCQFQQMAQRGRASLSAGRWDAARLELGSALSMWRGPMLAGIGDDSLAWPEVVAAENARLDALEDYFRAELSCGRHREVLPSLEAAVEQNASREHLVTQLMVALYGAGRQIDALSVYRRTCTLLREQYGVEPGRGLRQLESAILNHEPYLESMLGLPSDILTERETG